MSFENRLLDVPATDPCSASLFLQMTEGQGPTLMIMKTTNGRQKVLNATSFTIVRNPWDRIRSAYEGKIVTGKIRPQDGPTGRLMTFMEFILRIILTIIGIGCHLQRDVGLHQMWKVRQSSIMTT